MKYSVEEKQEIYAHITCHAQRVCCNLQFRDMVKKKEEEKCTGPRNE
jgi:hypothetical protein